MHAAREKSGPFLFWNQSGRGGRDVLPGGLRAHALGTMYRPSDPAPDGRVSLVSTHLTHLVIPMPNAAAESAVARRVQTELEV